MENGNPIETEKNRSANEPKKTKKPYVKPEFRYEKVFETQALSCGKVGGISTQCKLNSKNS